MSHSSQSVPVVALAADDRLLKPEEAAGVVGSTWKTLAKWRCHGVGPAFVKIGRSVRYRMSDLQKYINGLQGGLQ